jgi:hypothetical protein
MGFDYDLSDALGASMGRSEGPAAMKSLPAPKNARLGQTWCGLPDRLGLARRAWMRSKCLTATLLDLAALLTCAVAVGPIDNRSEV